MASSPKPKKRVVVLDGGTGTALAKFGHSSIDDDILWCAGLIKTHPEHVQKLHKDYLLAGADVVLSATYQASVDGFVKQFNVSEDEALELIKRGVRLAKAARDEAVQVTGRRAFVAASVGPYGATLCDRSEYHGRYVDNMTREELCAWHRPRLGALVAARPDLLAIETIPALEEALALLHCLEQTQVRAYVTFTLKDAKTTAHGEDIREALSAVVRNPAVVAVGANCFDLALVDGFLAYVKDLPLYDKPLIIKPNGGRYRPQGWAAEKFEIHQRVVEWVDAGARWIGGCCATDFTHINRIRKALEKPNHIRFLKKHLF